MIQINSNKPYVIKFYYTIIVRDITKKYLLLTPPPYQYQDREDAALFETLFNISVSLNSQ